MNICEYQDTRTEEPGKDKVPELLNTLPTTDLALVRLACSDPRYESFTVLYTDWMYVEIQIENIYVLYALKRLSSSILWPERLALLGL